MGRLDFLYRMELPHRAVSVYIYLLDRANKEGECWPAISTIASELKLSQSTVRRALRDLRKAGLLETEQRYRRGGGKSSLLYKIRNNKMAKKYTCHQGGIIPIWWQVIPVMMAGECEGPTVRYITAENRN